MAYAKACDSQFMYRGLFKMNMLRDFKPDDSIPKLMISILNGGKESGSKIKFSKFYLIFDFAGTDVQQGTNPEEPCPIDLHEVYFKLVQ